MSKTKPCPECGADARYQWGTVYDVLCYDEKGYIISSPQDALYHCDNGHDFSVYFEAGGKPVEKAEGSE